MRRKRLGYRFADARIPSRCTMSLVPPLRSWAKTARGDPEVELPTYNNATAEIMFHRRIR
jgi:hypothetical protein